MSKSPKTRKIVPKPRTAKGRPARKAAKTARRTATSGQAATKLGRRSDRPHGNAKRPGRTDTKQALLIGLLERRSGATITEAVAASGWQPHSVRGFLSGTVKKKLGLDLASETLAGRGRVYRIAKRP